VDGAHLGIECAMMVVVEVGAVHPITAINTSRGGAETLR
jgi:hypothetical protein